MHQYEFSSIFTSVQAELFWRVAELLKNCKQNLYWILICGKALDLEPGLSTTRIDEPWDLNCTEIASGNRRYKIYLFLLIIRIAGFSTGEFPKNLKTPGLN